MRIGTKSVLFGIHSPPIHSFFMGLAWLKLYGFSREFLDPRLHLCFWLHDIGYWNCKEMDGEDGERHPLKGAEIVGFFFGYDWWLFNITHSGSMIKILNKQGYDYKPSKLYYADKLASPLYPKFLYKVLSLTSGEFYEYAENHFGLKFLRKSSYPNDLKPYIFTDGNGNKFAKSFEDWWLPAMRHMKERADGRK